MFPIEIVFLLLLIYFLNYLMNLFVPLIFIKVYVESKAKYIADNQIKSCSVQVQNVRSGSQARRSCPQK